MASFADFIAWPDRREIVLAEVTPSLTLRGWAAAGGGFTNTYKVALSRFYLSSVITGGMYRRCVGVRENGSDLTERASIALVDANPSSWFWDEAAGLLYVRTSTAASPDDDAFRAYQAFVTYYMATAGIVLNRTDGDPSTGVYYQPWLSGELPRLSQFREDLIHSTKITEGGDLGFTNAHGFWNHAIPDHNWANKRIRLFFGGTYNGQELLRSQYVALRAMLVDDLAADEATASMKLKPITRRLDRSLPITPYFTSDYPNLGEGVSGTRKAIGYGRAVVRPALTDTVTSQGVWTVADAAYQTLADLHAVRAINKSTGVRTTLALTTDYTVNLATCTVTIVNATYNHQSYDIEVDVTGRTQTTFAAIVQDILTRFCGVALADVDEPAFAQAALDAPQVLSAWFKAVRSINSILSTDEPGMPSLERSVLGTVQQTADGKWTCAIWQPGYDASTVVSLRKEDFASLRGEPKIESIFPTTRVLYGYNHSRDEWQGAQSTNERNQFESESSDESEVHTFLTDGDDALTLAQRHQVMSDETPLELEFVERGAKLAQAAVGDVVLVTFDPLPVTGGEALNKAFEIIRLDIAFDPTLVISGRLGDLQGVGERIGHWMASPAPAWSAATQAERDESGFWSDSSGRIDPADETTKDLSIWW